MSRTIYATIGDECDVSAWSEGRRFHVKYRTQTGMHVHLKALDLLTFRRALHTAERDERRIPQDVYERIHNERMVELEATR